MAALASARDRFLHYIIYEATHTSSLPMPSQSVYQGPALQVRKVPTAVFSPQKVRLSTKGAVREK